MAALSNLKHEVTLDMAHFDMVEKENYLNLLEESFPGLKTNILHGEMAGFRWESRPFLKKLGKEICSHVGCLEYPMLIEGHRYKAGGLHAICSKITHRGQGLASELIHEVIAWTKKHYDYASII